MIHWISNSFGKKWLKNKVASGDKQKKKFPYATINDLDGAI